MICQPMAQRIEHWLLDKLIPYARNPWTHSDAQTAQRAGNIAQSGFNSSILIDSKRNIVPDMAGTWRLSSWAWERCR